MYTEGANYQLRLRMSAYVYAYMKTSLKFHFYMIMKHASRL